MDMTGFRRLAVAVLLLAVAVLLLVAVAAPAAARTKGQLPAPLAADCGPGVTGIGFTSYACSDGDGGTKYAHPSELLVLRTNGSYVGYRDSISEPDRRARSATGGGCCRAQRCDRPGNRISTEALVSHRQLDRCSRSPGLVAINTLIVTAADTVFFRANYYGASQHGCATIRAEVTAGGRVKVFWRSATGLDLRVTRRSGATGFSSTDSVRLVDQVAP